MASGRDLPGHGVLGVDLVPRRAVRRGLLGGEGAARGFSRGVGRDQRLRPRASQARSPAVRLAARPTAGAALGGRVADAATKVFMAAGPLAAGCWPLAQRSFVCI